MVILTLAVLITITRNSASCRMRIGKAVGEVSIKPRRNAAELFAPYTRAVEYCLRPLPPGTSAGNCLICIDLGRHRFLYWCRGSGRHWRGGHHTCSLSSNRSRSGRVSMTLVLATALPITAAPITCANRRSMPASGTKFALCAGDRRWPALFPKPAVTHDVTRDVTRDT